MSPFERQEKLRNAFFEDGAGVGDVEEGWRLGLQFDELARWEVGGFDLEEVAGIE